VTRLGKLAVVISMVATGWLSGGAPASAATNDVPCDAVCSRILNQQNAFVTWLASNGVQGYVGEVGWPDDGGANGADWAKWNAVGEQWFRVADKAGLWVTAWAAGERWGPTGRLSVWESTAWGSPVNRANTQAAVVGAHLGATGRGVNSNGGDWGVPVKDVVTTFSNANPGTYGTTYTYDSQATYNYLASQGVKTVRLPFRWERVQPTVGGPLDAAEVGRIKAAVARAEAAGIGVILDVHNYGGYQLFDPAQGKGVRQPIGSAALPVSAFTDLWTKLAGAFTSTTGIVAFDVMNEPHDIPNGAKAWEAASQAAVGAIRSTGEARTVIVPTYQWSTISQVWATHPKAWITDPANNLRYETHHYFDLDGGGTYSQPYSTVLAEAVRRGFTSIVPLADGPAPSTPLAKAVR
jgi:hypothetical protein